MPGFKIKRGLVVFAACMAAAFLLLGAAETSHANHPGEEDACPICVIARHAENMFRQFRDAGPALVFSAVFFLLAALATKNSFDYIPVSPVKQKIKMNT
jgi:hypothetical protein